MKSETMSTPRLHYAWVVLVISTLVVFGSLGLARFTTRQRGLAAGIAVAGSSLASIIVGPVVPFLLAAYGENGWRVCWLIFGGITLLLAVGWFSLLCGLIWGTISDRIGRKPALIMVYLIHVVAFGLFAMWPAPPGFTLSAILFGLTAWSIPAIMAATCGDVLGPRLAPAAFGFLTFFFGSGQAIGPSLAGVIADAAGSFVPAFLLAAAMSLLALGVSPLRPASTVGVG